MVFLPYAVTTTIMIDENSEIERAKKILTFE